MKSRTVILIIAAWMGLIIGGYLLIRGDDDQATTTQEASTGPSPSPDQVITNPTSTQSPAADTQTTPSATPVTPTTTNPADPAAPDTTTPVTDPGTSTAAPPVTDPATTKVYTPAELEKLRTSDPDKYRQLTVDPQDRNPILARKQQQTVSAHPAFQKLPHQGSGITVDFTGARHGDRIELVVQYTTTKAKAAKALNKFLASVGDTGAGYTVIYRKGPHR